MHKSYMVPRADVLTIYIYTVPRTDAQIIYGTKNRCTNHKWYQEQMHKSNMYMVPRTDAQIIYAIMVPRTDA